MSKSPSWALVAVRWWSPSLLVLALGLLAARPAYADIPPGTGGAGTGGRGAGGSNAGTGGAPNTDGGAPKGGGDDGGCSVGSAALDVSVGGAMFAIGLGALAWSRRRSGRDKQR